MLIDNLVCSGGSMQLAKQKYHEYSQVAAPMNGQELYRSAAINFIEQLVSQLFSIPIHVIRTQKRGNSNVAFARQTTMYLCHVSLSLSLSEVANAFRRDRSTVMHACRVVENERDNPEFDAILEFLDLEICNWNRCWKAMF